MSEKSLRILSIAYLIIPNILFYYNWTNLPITVTGILILLYLIFQDIKGPDFSSVSVLGKKDALIIGITTLILTFVSGTSGFCYQTFDYWCHNTKFYELLNYTWPIKIPQDGAIISYYYGYYVVPALYSKITGNISETFIFLWTWLGIAIGITWVYLNLGKKIIFVFMALCIGDLPHVLKTVLYKLSIKMYEFGDFGIENWSNFENLLWVPNQVIPTLIIGGMFVHIIKKNLNLDLMVLPVALTFWWAVFPAFTTGLLVGLLLIREWVLAKFQLDWIRIFKKVLLPALACLPILIFFLSHEESPVAGFSWTYSPNYGNTFKEYLVNIGINAVLFLTSYLYFRKLKLPYLAQFPFYLLIVLTVLFPVYRVGKVNDFLFRGMMPFLIIIGMYLFYPLTAGDSRNTFSILKKSLVGIVLVLGLCFSSFIGAGRIVRAATTNQLTAKLMPQKVSFTPIPYNAYPNIYEVLKDKWTQQEANQYLGKIDSFYEKYLAP